MNYSQLCALALAGAATATGLILTSAVTAQPTIGDRTSSTTTVQPIAQPTNLAQFIRISPPSQTRKTPRPTTTASTTMAQELVNAHNQWRAEVGVPPLKWSPKLASYAQEWANNLVKRRGLVLQHRSNSPYGENLFGGQGRQWSPTEVVGAWGKEKSDYIPSTGKCRNNNFALCGHYTQVVWSKTTEVGCAVARSGNKEIWVCNYNPPGNFVGQKPY